MNRYHNPVMVREAVGALVIRPGHWYIDGTLGGGGHAAEIVRQGGNVLGFDVDRDAIDYCNASFVRMFPDRVSRPAWIFVKESYAAMGTVARRHNITGAAGVLLDLGVSGHQLEDPLRGFGYQHGQQIPDMRFDRESGFSALDLLKQSNREELYEIFSQYGEEKFSRSIADAVVSARQVTGITTIDSLSQAVRQAVGKAPDINAILARVFQALRISVNRELDTLRNGLTEAETVLNKHGRLAVISYHSLEDRIVKRFFVTGEWVLMTKKPLRPEHSEIARNSRARSAKLRVGYKS
ncbi:16S rRNA (cytosine(1402)-N(4))-methyltransferase [Candidatus Gottesmanbacteria bacterium RBG_16_52_11]|uniref:Ribosomal RNA small subunit methyltransferase H n=1 Tax=Candidatus Gottesmanbacteria bacterium RBG_16_52_11 TaxID=1798374 RepID=A0A1F5YV74_9BACT|nr:MAG: 16S rRNA (cytosine(1402)-N(4))-methyltransferase [Candidatus Gottesmanbacteria bacterium RBG_16_52_11]